MTVKLPFAIRSYDPPFDPQSYRHREALKWALKYCLSEDTGISIAPKTAAAFAVICYARKRPENTIGITGDSPDTIIALAAQDWIAERTKYEAQKAKEKDAIDSGDWGNVPIGALALNISTRLEQIAIYHHCESVGDLIAIPENCAKKIPNIGAKTLAEFRALKANPRDFVL